MSRSVLRKNMQTASNFPVSKQTVFWTLIARILVKVRGTKQETTKKPVKKGLLVIEHSLRIELS